MILLNETRKFAANLYYTYKNKKLDDKVNQQKETVSYIYDSIIKKIPIHEIEKNIFTYVSVEIRSILNTLKKIGYIKIPPLQTPPTITIVIPHFNHQAYLDETLLYITKQTELPEEVLIIDDLSDDVEKVKKIAKKYQSKLNIRVITPQRKLFSGGCRQLGAELATSNLIVMHDADDISHQNRIACTKYFFKTHPQALHLNFGLVHFRNKFFPHVRKFSIDELNKNLLTTDKIIDSMRDMFVEQKFSRIDKPPVRWGRYTDIRGCFWECNAGHVAYRKDIVNFVKWSNPHNYTFTKFEDYEFNFLLLLAAQQSFQIDLPLIYYRTGSSTIDIDYRINTPKHPPENGTLK